MQGEWKVTSNIFGGKKVFAVFRLRDVDATDHSGNREYATEWLESRAEAEAIAEMKNLQETTFGAITKDKPTLAGFLRSLPIIEAPWDAAFQKHYCSSCTAEDCDACKNEQFRNNPEWWLSLPAAEVEQ